MMEAHNDLFVWIMVGHLEHYFQSNIAVVDMVDTVPFHKNFVVDMMDNSNNLNSDALA